MAPIEVVVCVHCGRAFQSKDDFRAHWIKAHKAKTISYEGLKGYSSKRRVRRITCPSCKKNFTNSEILDSHLKSHGVFVEEESLKFSNVQGFNCWKTDLEKRTTSHFIISSGKKSYKNGNITYYTCHRSFFYNSTATLKKGKIMGTNKMNAKCPARMTVFETENGEVKVKFWSTHYGHEKEIKRNKLSKDDKIVLAGRLLAGVPMPRILKESQSIETPSQRIHLLSRYDLYNIKKGFKISSAVRKHEYDSDSVNAWIKELKQSSDNPILLHKGQTSNKYFILVLMTQYQMKILKKFGPSTICIDSTYGMNKENCRLTTLLVLDDNHEGLPVAFCFTTVTSRTTYELFFSAVKQKVGTIKARTFVSDGQPKLYNAWVTVMGSTKEQLLCPLGAGQNWIKNKMKIKNEERRLEVLEKINKLIKEPNESIFTHELEELMAKLKKDRDTTYFYKYFSVHLVPRMKCWSSRLREGTRVCTKMSLDRFQRRFEYFYPESKLVRRLDEAIDAVLKLAKGENFKEIISSVEENKLNNLLDIDREHIVALENKNLINLIRSGKKTWLATSSDSDKYYVITRVREDPPCCSITCKSCDICYHNFSCSCPKYFSKVICNHIHVLHSSTSKYDSKRYVEQKMDSISVEYGTLPVNSSESRNLSNSGFERFMAVVDFMKQNIDPESIPKEVNERLDSLTKSLISAIGNSMPDMWKKIAVCKQPSDIMKEIGKSKGIKRQNMHVDHFYASTTKNII